MIIVDTNVVSEALKPLPSEAVSRWVSTLEPLVVFTTAISVAEVLYRVEALPSGKRRARLSEAVEKVFGQEFQDRILPFDEEAARLYPKIRVGREEIGRPIAESDAMIASIARSRHAALATRNARDFEHCGIRVIDPWAE